MTKKPHWNKGSIKHRNYSRSHVLPTSTQKQTSQRYRSREVAVRAQKYIHQARVYIVCIQAITRTTKSICAQQAVINLNQTPIDNSIHHSTSSSKSNVNTN